MREVKGDNRNDALNGARGLAVGVLLSVLLWLLIVGGVLLCYPYSG